MGTNIPKKVWDVRCGDGTYMTDLCEICERLTTSQFSLALSHSSQPETQKITKRKNGKQR
jgi:hypothetical protein